jgi:hypothetical protein
MVKNVDYIVCPICDNELLYLSSSHLKKHGLTIKKLREEIFDVVVYSETYLDSKRKQDSEYRDKNKDKLDIYFKEYREVNKDKRNDYQKQYRLDNVDDVREKDRLYAKENRDKKRAYDKEYRKLNKSKIDENRQKYRKNHPYRKIWGDLLYFTLKRLGKSKEGHTIDLLGYSATQFKHHIESLFTEGMSWDNHGEWHVDHIKPISSFPIDSPPSVVNALNNLRPLWATTRIINGIEYIGNLNKNKYYENNS